MKKEKNGADKEMKMMQNERDRKWKEEVMKVITNGRDKARK